MPIVRVTLGAGRSVEQKAALASDMCEAIVRRCGADPANINILFEDVALDQWIVGSDALKGDSDG